MLSNGSSLFIVYICFFSWLSSVLVSEVMWLPGGVPCAVVIGVSLLIANDCSLLVVFFYLLGDIFIDLFVIVVFLLFVLVFLVVLVLLIAAVFVVEFPGLYCVVFLLHLMEIVFLDCQVFSWDMWLCILLWLIIISDSYLPNL